MNNYDNIMPHLFEGVYIVDPNRKIIFWNKASEEITGYKAEEVVNKHCFNNILNHVTEDGKRLCFGGCPMHHTLQTGKMNEGNVFLHHKDGHRVPVEVRTFPLYNDDNEVIAAVEVFSDIRYKKETFVENRRLRKMLNIDQLTDIYNRRYLDMYLVNKKNEAKEFKTTFGILFFDIDDFKNVNDKYGHNVGDLVLQMVARTLVSGVRSGDIIGRWGGEEFIAIIDTDNINALRYVANKLRILVESSALPLDGADLRVTISIGGTLFQDLEAIDKTVERADKLMYDSKKTGKNKATIE